MMPVPNEFSIRRLYELLRREPVNKCFGNTYYGSDEMKKKKNIAQKTLNDLSRLLGSISNSEASEWERIKNI